MPIGNLREYAPNLRLGPEGWWASSTVSDVSYPEEGNTRCFAVEEASFWFEHRNRCIVETIRRFPPNGPLFDVGGGNGWVARAIQESGFEVVLVEPGLAGVQNALKRGIHQVVRSTLEDAGVLPETLPAVGLFDVVEHIDDDIGFLAKTKRLIVPGGRIYITVPAYRWLWSAEDIHAGHFHRYDLQGVTRILEKAGYAIDFATYIFSFLPLPIFFCRALPYRAGARAKIASENAVKSDHNVGNPALRKTLGMLTRWEVSRIANNRPMKFGGSCLIVARKR